MTDEPAIVDAVDFLHHPFTIEDAERLIRGAEDGTDCFWGVWLPEHPPMAGAVGTHLRGASEIEIGYWFSRAARGRGLARESVEAVVSALVQVYPHRLVYAECRPENAPSWTLLTRIGFEPSGSEGHRPGRSKLILKRPVGHRPGVEDIAPPGQ